MSQPVSSPCAAGSGRPGRRRQRGGVVWGQASSEQNEVVLLRRKARRFEQESGSLCPAAAYFAQASFSQ